MAGWVGEKEEQKNHMGNNENLLSPYQNPKVLKLRFFFITYLATNPHPAWNISHQDLPTLSDHFFFHLQWFEYGDLLSSHLESYTMFSMNQGQNSVCLCCVCRCVWVCRSMCVLMHMCVHACEGQRTTSNISPHSTQTVHHFVWIFWILLFFFFF